MVGHNENILMRLTNIANKYCNCIEDYNNFISKSSRKIMSRGIDLYGMFYPEMELSKYFIYKGKITNNETKKHFSYYFDNGNKLILTERYLENGLLSELIFYYYHENLREIVWYNIKRQTVSRVGFIDYKNNKLSSFVDSYNILRNSSGVKSFIEYCFDIDDDYVVTKSYSLDMLNDGGDWEKISKFKK